MLKLGVIQHSTSPYALPVLLVKKKDGSQRFCVDFICLNDLTVKDKFSIPIIEDLLNELHRAKVFLKFGLHARYHRIRMAPANIPRPHFEHIAGTMSSL